MLDRGTVIITLRQERKATVFVVNLRKHVALQKSGLVENIVFDRRYESKTGIVNQILIK